MKSKEIKTTIHLSEFEEEGKWLEKQHNQGWKLVGVSGQAQTKYQFEQYQGEE